MTLKQISFRLIFSVVAAIATSTVLSVITHKVLYSPLKPMFDSQVLTEIPLCLPGGWLYQCYKHKKAGSAT